jgi:hypothetical protein
MPPALNPAEYHRRLYEADVRPELLDYVGNEYSYDPSLFVRSLHEGQPIDFVNRTIDWNLTVSEAATREIGDTYLLIFAAVALGRFEELASVQRDFIVEAAHDFVTSLSDDGFQYSGGKILNHSGVPVVPVPLGAPLERGHTSPPQKRTEPQTRSENLTPRSDVRRDQTMPQKEQKDKSVVVALIGAAAVLIAALIGYLATHHDKSDPALVAYTGKVKNSKSFKPVGNAFVAITEDQKVPQRFTTDSEGVFFAQLSKDTQTMLLEVKATGYQDYSRRGPTVRTGSEDIFLEPVPVQPEKQPDSVKPVSVGPKNEGPTQKEDVATPTAQDAQNDAIAHGLEAYGDTDALESISYMYCGLQGCNNRPPNQGDVEQARRLWVRAVSQWTRAYNTTSNTAYSDRLREKIRPESGVSCNDHSCEPNSTHDNREFGISIPTNKFDPQ